MRNTRRRLLTFIIFALPLVLLGIMAGVVFNRYWHTAERDLGPVLETEATNALGHEVKVGKVTIKGGFVTVDDVRVAEGKTMAERGEIAHARRVILDFDLRRILLSKDKLLPLFANADVIDPVAHVRRDAAGKWNFLDLFKPPKGPPGRPAVGTINVTNGTIFYEDAALPRNPKRPADPIKTQFAKIAGHVQLDGDRSATWEAKAFGPPDQIRFAKVLGTYEPATQRLFLRIDADRLSLPLLARFLPPDANLTTGLGSGQLTLLRSLDAQKKPIYDYQADATVLGATVVSSRLGEPVQGINAVATVANGMVTVKADSGFAGSKLHAEGTILGFSNPIVNGWASGSGVQLQRVLTALRVQDKMPILRQVQASANVKANVSGPLKAPIVTASGPIAVNGPLPGGAALGQEGSLQVSFSGSLQAPRLLVSGTLPVVRFKQVTARNVFLSAVYTPARVVADFSGQTAGGTVTGRADVTPAGAQTKYQVKARARGVNIAQVPVNWAKIGNGIKPSGLVNADIVAQGQGVQNVPLANAQVEVKNLRYDRWTAQSAHGRLRTAGNTVFLEPFTVRDSKGFAVVTGSADIKRQTLNLRAEADKLDVAKLQLALQDRIKGQPLDATTQQELSGLLYLREGRITGTFKNPTLAGNVTGYDVGTDKLKADYVTASLHGNKDALTIDTGRAYQFPAAANVTGFIRSPLSKRPRVDLAGDFEDFSLLELARLAGSDQDVAGLAHGSFQVAGTLSQPEIQLPLVTVDGPRISDFDLQSLTVSAHYDPVQDKGTWFLDKLTAVRRRRRLPEAEWPTLTASGKLTNDKRFSVNANVTKIDLTMLDPYISDFVTITGSGELGGQLTGVIKDGKAEQVAGDLTARTTGLTVNEVNLGDLHGAMANEPARFTVNQDVIASSDLLIGSRASGVYLTPGPNNAPALVYNRTTDDLRVNGEMLGISIDNLRKAITNSPYVATHPDSVAANWLKPITNPLEGTLGGRFAVTGTAKDPTTQFSWNSSQARVQGNNIQRFEGTVTFNRQRIDLANATLQADEALFNASGSIGPDEVLHGSVDSSSLPISLVNRWFPGHPYLKDLSGTAESVHIDADGKQTNPAVTVSLLLKDVVWEETAAVDPNKIGNAPLPAPASKLVPTGAATIPADTTRYVKRLNRAGQEVLLPTTGRELWIASFDTSKITINGPANPGKISADNVHVTLREPDRIPSDPTKPRVPLAKPRQFLVYASGSSDFSWEKLDQLKDPRLDLVVNIPKQDIKDVLALLPRLDNDQRVTEDINGNVEARIAVGGTPSNPRMTGTTSVTADKLRIAGRVTELHDISASLLFTGDTVRVREFTAYTETTDPKTHKLVRTQAPVQISGELALNDNAKATPSVSFWPPSVNSGSAALRLTASHVRFAENNLPGLTGARFSTDDTSIDLTMSGALLRPLIKGSVNIQQADIKMPDAFAEGKPGPPPIFQPAFNVQVTLGDKVRILATPISAMIHTEPGQPVVLGGDVEGGDLTRLRLAGSLTIDSGVLAFPTARFTIARGGTVTLRYPFTPLTGLSTAPTLGVIVDLTATTRITAASAADPGRQKRYTITVEAHGPINGSDPLEIVDANSFGGNTFGGRGLRLTFRADPPDLALSSAGLQRRIVGLIGGESAVQDLFSNRPDIGRIVRQQVTDILSQSFLPGLLEKLGLGQGFEEFTVDISQLNVFTLRLSRQLFGPIYLGYWRQLSGGSPAAGLNQAMWEFKLSYRFKPQFQCSFTTGNQSTNAYLLEGVFKF
jgi:hypothetical protein